MFSLIKAMILEKFLVGLTLLNQSEALFLGAVVVAWMIICVITLMVIDGRNV